VLGVLGGAGALLALGGGYLLGLRHGRTELVVSPTAPGAAPGDAAAALAVVEQFHEFSAHSRLGVFRRAPGTAWGSPPPPFKALPGQRLVLPPPRRAAGGSPPTPLEAASTLLWMTAGVSEDRGGIAFRTAPSSGALFASEFYLIAHALPGIEPGAWHYEPRGHALVRLADAGALPPAALPGAPATVVASAIFPRSGHKYRDRTYRYVLADLGHALENLRVAAGALGGSIGFVRVFDDAPWGQALGLDPAEEGVLALAGWAPAGTPAAGTPPAAPPGPWRVPMPEAGAALGVTDAIHRATSLRAPGAQPTPGPPDAAAPGGAGPATATGRASAGAVDLPRPAVAPRDLLATIASRRSRRRYRTQAIALPALTEVLAALPGPGPLWSPALRIDVVTHAVDGLPPGAWRYEPAQQQLHRAFAAIGPGGAAAPDAAAWRRRSRSAGLGQDAIGDAAAVVVLSIDRAAFAADPAGPARGYRHAFLEAGAAGERLYLAAPALGLGVCAVGAFYDDEASALVGIDPSREWVVHFAALGIV
jgi:SagB-type dehydrogenase family enzyme